MWGWINTLSVNIHLRPKVKHGHDRARRQAETGLAPEACRGVPWYSLYFYFRQRRSSCSCLLTVRFRSWYPVQLAVATSERTSGHSLPQDNEPLTHYHIMRIMTGPPTRGIDITRRAPRQTPLLKIQWIMFPAPFCHVCLSNIHYFVTSLP